MQVALSGAAAAQVVEEFDFAAQADFIFLPVAVRGQTLRFIVDTGSTGSVFNGRLRHLLGEPRGTARVATVAGVEEIERFEAPATKLGKLEIRYDRGRVYCQDFGDAFRCPSKPIDGVLGIDALKAFVVSIDFDEGKLRVLDSVAPEPGEGVPLIWHKQRGFLEGPFALATLAGRSHREFLIDTGSHSRNSGGVEARFFDWLSDNGDLDWLGYTDISSFSKTATVRQGRANSIAVGGFEYRGAVFDRMKKNSLGLGFLCRFKVTFDFPNNVMYLRKGKSFDREDVYNLSGIHLVRRNGETIVHSVDSESAGSAADLRQHDVLLVIGDTKASDLSMFELRQRLCRNGSCRLTIRRGHAELTIDLRLGDKPAPNAERAEKDADRGSQ
ncbi:MAG TPA: aspartyl protease family protein [Pirellulales bacterium]|nr:aspartyl protease family protein [Pirellulales bacterium]